MGKKKQKHRAAAPQLQTPASPQKPVRERKPLSRSKVILFALLCMTVLPALVLLTAELVLRATGGGYPTRFFLHKDAHLIDNVKFGWRFFPPTIARRPYDYQIPEKPTDRTFRIFVLGESAAWGDPDPSFSFNRILGAMLRDQFPDVHFEVVNCAMAAINSHVVRHIAMDGAKHQPDLFIVYMGNNEIIGPFGPGTAFARFSPNLSSIRTAIELKSLKFTQAMNAVVMAVQGPGRQPQAWAGMQMFEKNKIRSTDPRLRHMYDFFERNLNDICRSGKQAGAKLILCNMAANLNACPPFASLHRPDLSQEQIDQFEARYKAAVQLQEENRIDEALAAFESCEKIDSQFAELLYRIAMCRERKGDAQDARRYYDLARDEDALRFRSDTPINKIIRATAGKQGAAFVDVIAEFEKNSPNGIPGNELLVDHVHMNFRGNYLIARSLLAPVAEEVAKRMNRKARNSEAPLSEKEAAAQLAYTPWNHFRVTEKNLQRVKNPPFTNQLDNAIQRADFEAELKDLETTLTPAALEECAAQYRRAIDHTKGESDSSDWALHENFADLLQRMGRSAEESEQLRIVLKLLPHHQERNKWLGQSLADQGKLDEAVDCYKKAIAYNNLDVDARKGLGDVLMKLRRTDEALLEYKAAAQVRPTAENINQLGEMYFRAGNLKKARAQFQKAADRQSDFAPAITNLGVVALESKQPDEARRHFEQAVAANPEFADAHRYLGHLAMQSSDFQAAARHYEAAIRLKPQPPEVYNNIAAAYSGLGRPADGIVHLRTAVELQPRVAQVHKNLGMLLNQTGDRAGAVAELQTAVTLNPADQESRGLLQRLGAGAGPSR